MKNLIPILFLVFLGFYANAQNKNVKAVDQKADMTALDLKIINDKLNATTTQVDTLKSQFAKISALDKLRFNNVSKSILKRSNAIFAICFIIGLFVIIVSLYFNSIFNKNLNNINASLHHINQNLKKEIEELREQINNK